MSAPDTLTSETSNPIMRPDSSTFARVLPIVSLCSSIFFAMASVVTWIALATVTGYDVLVPLIIGVPFSVGGSFFLAFLPAIVLRAYVDGPRVNWSIGISAVSAALGGGLWLFIASRF